MTVATQFGALLRRLRLTAGLTQEALAGRAGVSAKAVRGLERDPNRAPRLETVALLADALRLDPTERARLLAAARPESVAPAEPTNIAAPPPVLPRPLTPLIGREGVVSEVVELVRRGEHQLVTRTGRRGQDAPGARCSRARGDRLCRRRCVRGPGAAARPGAGAADDLAAPGGGRTRAGSAARTA